MKTKNYIGTSRPCGEYNKGALMVIEGNLQHFNKNKRKGIITVEHYIAGGDQWQLLIDEKPILTFMSLDQLYYAVAGIVLYAKEMR